MASGKYSYKPRNLLRTGLALWRVLRDTEDTNANVYEAAIVEFAFNRSRWGRRVARWDLLAAEAAATSDEVASLMQARVRLPDVDLDALAELPPGSLGRTFAELALKRGIDPNLVEKMPADSDGDWLMASAYETHDFWHLITGFYYNLEGEFGVAGFYMGQLPRFSFIAFFSAILMIRTVWNDRDAVATHTRAFVEGYEMGRRARCLFGLNWAEVYDQNLDELRAQWRVEQAGRIPEPAMAA
jgi:ubiquinone biosynthesis protein Coq4